MEVFEGDEPIDRYHNALRYVDSAINTIIEALREDDLIDDTLLIVVDQGTDQKNRIFIQDLRNPSATPVSLIDEFDGAYHYIGNEGEKFWFHTNNNASRGKIIEIDINNFSQSNWIELIPEMPQTILAATRAGDRILVSYLDDAKSMVRNFDLDGNRRGEVELPGVGSTGGFAKPQKKWALLPLHCRFICQAIS